MRIEAGFDWKHWTFKPFRQETIVVLGKITVYTHIDIGPLFVTIVHQPRMVG